MAEKPENGDEKHKLNPCGNYTVRICYEFGAPTLHEAAYLAWGVRKNDGAGLACAGPPDWGGGP